MRRRLAEEIEELLSSMTALDRIRDLLKEEEDPDEEVMVMQEHISDMVLTRGGLYDILATANDDGTWEDTHELYRAPHEEGQGNIVLVHRVGRPHQFGIWQEYQGDRCQVVLTNDLKFALENAIRRSTTPR